MNVGRLKIMVKKAFVLINTRGNVSVEDTIKQIAKINGVVEVFALYGVYEIVAKLEAKTHAKLKEVRNLIRGLDGRPTTLTLICIEEVENHE